MTTTRAQQREATRAALLDATISSLVDVGYAATTTRGIAQRAGVSQGAQQHHFPTKAALVDAAITRLAEATAATVLADPPQATTERERAALLLDELWSLHNLPFAAAIAEVITAARTDPELARGVARALDDIGALAMDIARKLVPELATIPGVEDWLAITMASIRGTVLVTAVPGAGGTVPPWRAMREQILRGLDALIAEGRPGSGAGERRRGGPRKR